MSVLSVSLSGIQAAVAKLNVSAENVANSQTTGALPDAPPSATSSTPGAPTVYQPKELASFSVAGSLGGGVTTTVRPSLNKPEYAYAPSASYANAQGLVASPNVDPAVEAVNQIESLQQFKANLKVFQTGEEMMAIALNLKA